MFNYAVLQLEKCVLKFRFANKLSRKSLLFDSELSGKHISGSLFLEPRIVGSSALLLYMT